jgi:chemosensory pili system protein ChpA (sensor histidine kinase/response regulator)
VHGVSRLSVDEYEHYEKQESLSIESNGKLYKRVYLSQLLGLEHDSSQAALRSLLFVSVADELLAIQVEVVGKHLEVINKPVGRQLLSIGGYAGASVQPDGSVIPTLNLTTLWLNLKADSSLNASAEQVQTLSPHQRLQVMVVDDSITMRKFAERTLLRENYLPVLARDGMQAMSLMRQRRPDVVLTDLEMPHMDGFELIEMIRSDEALHDLPIIVISSRTGELHRQGAKSQDVQGYLCKPYQESELLALISKLLGL